MIKKKSSIRRKKSIAEENEFGRLLRKDSKSEGKRYRTGSYMQVSYQERERYSLGSELAILRSSWEGRKRHFGHVRKTPSMSPRPSYSREVVPPTLILESGEKMPLQTFRISKIDGTDTLSSSQQQVDQRTLVFNSVEEFVNHHCEDLDKRRYIKKVLVATNGTAAVKCINSMRRLFSHVFGDDRIVKFVSITTEQEIASKAEYLKLADDLAISPSGANVNNYANVDEIVHHAITHKVDAVWAGWGHASENPRLPQELSNHGISFIGPPAKAMFALGDKIASTIIAQTVNVPTIEWSGSGITVPEICDDDSSTDDLEVEIPSEVYKAACVRDPEQGIHALRLKNITYPVMIKASEGGGGKGIRKCNNDDEFRLNFHRVEAEVPGSPIFVMKCVVNARHIEVQLMGDWYGNVIPIFTRDCTIQRRHQKVIEEAPAVIVPQHVRYRMQMDAANLAKKVGYVNAGTVEYLYLPDDQNYYFLELNPRLQVEHPCTEMVANINIPAIQLQVAMGIPLHRISDIRMFFGMDRYGISPLPEEQNRIDSTIHVIAARITSEDPAEGFRPASGSIEELSFHSSQNVWGYFSVCASGQVHEFADSQFGHLFARGTTRSEAISALLCALRQLEVRATFASTVSYLVGLLNDYEYQNNLFHTGWLDARIAANIQIAPEFPTHVSVAIGATLIGHSRITEVFSKFQNALERGQILPKSCLTETWELELVHKNIKYSVLVNRYSPIDYLIELNGSKVHIIARELGNGILIITYSDQSYTCHLEEEAERFKVTIGKTVTIFDKENDPSILRSRNVGRLLQYLKKDGEYVSVGEVYAEIESMKMVINLEVQRAGGRIVQVAQPGQVLNPGTLIARLIDQGDVFSSKPTTFTGTFAEWEKALVQETERWNSLRLNNRFENIFKACENILAGYMRPEKIFEEHVKMLVDDLFMVLNNSRLPYSLFRVKLNVVASRINPETCENIKKLVQDESKPFCSQALIEEMNSYLGTLDPSELGMEKQYFEELLIVCESFDGGLRGHIRRIISQLLEEYLETETYFQDVAYDKGVSAIKSCAPDLISSRVPASRAPDLISTITRMVYSHTRILAKNLFMKELISRLDQQMVLELQPILKKLANMFNTEIDPLALFVREVLNKIHQRNYGQLCSNLSRRSSERTLNDLLTGCSTNNNELKIELQKVLKSFASANGDDDLILHEFFFTTDAETNLMAIKLFIQKTFQVNEREINVLQTNSAKALIFRFEILPRNPLYPFHQKNDDTLKNRSSPFVYFLSVISELDLLRNRSIVELLKKYSNIADRNTFLFVAYPRGENGFSSVINLPESELKQLGKTLRKEVNSVLEDSGVRVQDVDLMFSRPSHPPIYSTEFDFSANEKLELYRLSKDAQNLTVTHSPFMIFRVNDSGVNRLFVRRLIRDLTSILHIDRFSPKKRLDLLREKIIDILDGACGEIRVCTASDKSKATYDCNHIFIRLEYDEELSTDGWPDIIESALSICEKYLVKHRVTEVEVNYQYQCENNAESALESIKVVYLNELGAIPEICTYRVASGKLEPFDNRRHARCTGNYSFAMYPSIRQVQMQKKRFQASRTGTTYVYDYPTMIAKAVFDLWVEFKTSDPNSFRALLEKLDSEKRESLLDSKISAFATACEMVLTDEFGEISIITDPALLLQRAATGANDRGMIAWIVDIWTPDVPKGRKIVVIANDITFQAGSFSMREHRLYKKASEYSRTNKLPRIYISSNSGARIGLASDVKQHLRLVWNNEEHLEEGFRYLSLTTDGEKDTVLKQIETTKCPDGRLRIDAVVGKENDIGVENLVGSGLIAGETCAAYKEVPTYCLVTGRAVGIGAYAARLAHRICQVESSHIILTGANALNTMLNREVYTSNNQLGGPQIMYHNGVSHSVVSTDLEGIKTIMKWISYLPHPYDEKQNATVVVPPLFMLKDDKARCVDTYPTRSAYDPREILDPTNEQGGGLFDRGSFNEIMGGWAKIIIAGRARLRGLPVGVIAVETRAISFEVPADPAAQDSQVQTVMNVGQIWTPASAYKTAEVISNFNHEGLPLIFIANIRGFSGGQKDMYEMVLKFGALIVDALQAYTQPVITYIPPFGELRGGAWAVVDTQINSTCIRMLADPESRGGVLEPSGLVEIKFRERDLQQFLSRCDPELQLMESTLSSKIKKGETDELLQKTISARREKLMPICKAAAVKFADLHDTTARMLAKGAIHDEVPWRNARNYFYELFNVELAKMHMARRYLKIFDNHANTIDIDGLKTAYQWVTNHLEEAGIKTCRNLSPTERTSRHARYQYIPDEVIRYANSDAFHQICSQVQRSFLLKQLNALNQTDRRLLLDEARL